jgi:oligopeptide/dipeptide ABC transporter ATP-binding protein
MMDTPQHDSTNLLELKQVVKEFPITKGVLLKQKVGAVHAVNGVDLIIKKGETVGLVGESGCGKTTLGKIILKLVPPSSGEVIFHGVDIYSTQHSRSRFFRGKINTVFQDPFSSLDPRMSVYQIVAEPLKVLKVLGRRQRRERVVELLELIGLSTEHLNRYPHEFSGGQRQRIAIARALALDPELIIADEPTSALDVSIQAQIINLLEELQERLKLAYLLISHDLNLVYHISQRIGVMYLGKIVELADAEELYHNPLHPYTQALISAVPPMGPDDQQQRIVLKGVVQSPIDLPTGCIFSRRCLYTTEECRRQAPPLIDTGNQHHVACIRAGQTGG